MIKYKLIQIFSFVRFNLIEFFLQFIPKIFKLNLFYLIKKNRATIFLPAAGGNCCCCCCWSCVSVAGECDSFVSVTSAVACRLWLIERFVHFFSFIFPSPLRVLSGVSCPSLFINFHWPCPFGPSKLRGIFPQNSLPYDF